MFEKNQRTVTNRLTYQDLLKHKVSLYYIGQMILNLALNLLQYCIFNKWIAFNYLL